MASTAHKTEDEKKEYFDTKEDLEKKVDQLAELIKKSKHFVVFTGAGISTSTGIPDFRSGYNTVLETGPGAWEKMAVEKPDKKRKIVPFLSAIPSYTHMAFVKLMEKGILKFVVSQNVDGLHRKSGIPPDKLAELHGNVNLEKCKKCHKEYLRDFDVGGTASHVTGRRCTVPGCNGLLYDTIINFGENLPAREIEAGYDNCIKADVCLCLGSSLRVTPAADMPLQMVKAGGQLFIVKYFFNMKNLCKAFKKHHWIQKQKKYYMECVMKL